MTAHTQSRVHLGYSRGQAGRSGRRCRLVAAAVIAIVTLAGCASASDPASGDNPVLEWTKGTLLPPLLGQLSESEAKTFVEDYSQRVAAAYPRRADGKTVLPFRRVFMIAVKS